MPTSTYDLIASNVLTSSASSVTFSSIPATYRDLVLVVNGVSTPTVGRSVRAQFNSDTGSNYSQVSMGNFDNTSSSSSSTGTNLTVGSLGPGIGIFHIFDYSTTDKHKTCLTRYGQPDLFVFGLAQRWANTNAITSILLFPNADEFASGTTFYLYGIVS